MKQACCQALQVNVRQAGRYSAQVTPEQVAAAVTKVVASEQEALQERRYLFNQNILVGKVPWSPAHR
jgi:hypothetical protein